MTLGTPIASRRVGSTELFVPELGFGAATLGNLYAPMPDSAAELSLRTARDHGLFYVDTAPYYGFGLSERRVGDALRGRPNTVISTKVGRLLLPDASVADDSERFGYHTAMPFRPVFDYTYDGIMRSYEASIQRLGLATIDILYVHDIGTLTHGPDGQRHFDDLVGNGGFRALERLRDAGAIKAFGLGVNEVEICDRAMDHARLDVILLAGRYTLLEQGPVASLFPKCIAAGTSIVIGGPFNSGILITGVKQGAPARYNYEQAPPGIITKVKAIEEVCDAFAVPLAAAALQFPLAHPVVACVIPGLASPDQVTEAVRLYGTSIPADLWTELRRQGLIDAAAPVPSRT